MVFSAVLRNPRDQTMTSRNCDPHEEAGGGIAPPPAAFQSDQIANQSASPIVTVALAVPMV